MKITEALSTPISRLGLRLQRWKQRMEEANPESAAPEEGSLTSSAYGVAVPSPAENRLPGMTGVGSESVDQTSPLTRSEPGSLPQPYSPKTNIENNPVSGLEASVGAKDTPAQSPGGENAPAAETTAAKDPAMSDLMDLFTQDNTMNTHLNQLATSLEDVDVKELVAQCREVSSLLKARRRMRR